MTPLQHSTKARPPPSYGVSSRVHPLSPRCHIYKTPGPPAFRGNHKGRVLRWAYYQTQYGPGSNAASQCGAQPPTNTNHRHSVPQTSARQVSHVGMIRPKPIYEGSDRLRKKEKAKRKAKLNAGLRAQKNLPVASVAAANSRCYKITPVPTSRNQS